ncbi:hypothetical protein EX30DRAFT_339679 [Ascodesmis nigricans]|uniref:Uncharacterized protein n=1 Tax=Ascodesmis nigricans TaxID=341454 RepID=A0A4V3SJ28_9PEZI|nr:hypothetical protein EX30DRAFT_339679 [Ascodesmis nigricans]
MWCMPHYPVSPFFLRLWFLGGVQCLAIVGYAHVLFVVMAMVYLSWLAQICVLRFLSSSLMGYFMH